MLNQWASSVDSFSSQYTSGNWSANQVLGAPNTFGYGDIATAWAPLPVNGSIEFIEVSFLAPVYAFGALIRETYGNGFVRKVEVRDTNDVFHTVWAGVDTSLPGAPVDFLVSWATTGYLVDGLRITTDTNHNPSTWEEIDAIQLRGSSEAPARGVPDSGASAVLLAAGLAGLVALRTRRR